MKKMSSLFANLIVRKSFCLLFLPTNMLLFEEETNSKGLDSIFFLLLLDFLGLFSCNRLKLILLLFLKLHLSLNQNQADF